MTNVSSTVEFVHRFEGAGREATSALIENFERRSGEYTVRERVDEDLRLTVKTRILRNDPPDVWDDWCGKNLESYVASDGVPTRSDVDTSTLHPFFREQSRSFERSRRVATSLAHGAGVDAGTLIDLKGATAEFVSTRDSNAGTAAFVEALSADR